VGLSVCDVLAAFDDVAITHGGGTITDDFNKVAGTLVGTNTPPWMPAGSIGLPSGVTSAMVELHTDGAAAVAPPGYGGCAGNNQALAAVAVDDTGVVDVDVTLAALPASSFVALTLVDEAEPHTSLVVTADGGGQLYHTVSGETRSFHVFEPASFEAGDRISMTVDGDTRTVAVGSTVLYHGDGTGMMAVVGICDTPGSAGGALIDDFVTASVYTTLASDDFAGAAGTIIGGAGRWQGPFPLAGPGAVQPVFYDGAGHGELPASSGVTCDVTDGDGSANAGTVTATGATYTGFTLARMPVTGAVSLMLFDPATSSVLVQLVVLSDGAGLYTSPSETGSFAPGTFTATDQVRIESSAAGFELQVDGTTVHPV
jgi:hypothetical protein